MRITIVGAGGALGRHLAAACRERGWEVVELPHSKVDITQPRQVREALQACDCVVNCAAQQDYRAVQHHRHRAIHVNAEGARTLALSCLRRGIRFVHISCACVFDGMKPTAYTEADTPRPLNVLGLSKFMGEKAVRAEGGRSLIVRLPFLLGSQPWSPAMEWLAAVRAGRFPLRVPEQEVVAPAYVGHAASALADVIAASAEGILHIGASGRCTWAEFARALIERVSPGGEVVEVPASSFYGGVPWPAQTVLEAATFRQLTGRALPDWRDALTAWLAECLPQS